MTDPAAGTRVEVHSDEDWKERVKNEDRLRDEQRSQPPEAAPAASEPADPFGRLPRAEFAVLVQIFVSQAMAALGLLSSPGDEPPQRRLSLARHFIDLLGVLEDKTRGNLTPQEEQLLTSSLHELRLVFVEMNAMPDAAAQTPTK